MRHIIASKNEYVNSKAKKYFQKRVDILINVLYTEHTNSKPQKKAKSGLKGLAGRDEKAPHRAGRRLLIVWGGRVEKFGEALIEGALISISDKRKKHRDAEDVVVLI